MCYIFDIFEKVMVRGTQKLCSRVCDVKIQKYKYTNTQIHKKQCFQLSDMQIQMNKTQTDIYGNTQI